MKHFSTLLLVVIALCIISCTRATIADSADLEADFRNPPKQAKPWAMWYRMNAADKPNDLLDAISTGLYFQRDQTWWKFGRAWVEYAQRCQLLLQHGKPVVDLAVYTGEESPSRSILPERLASTLDGYQYDSLNKDTLVRFAKVENGRIVLPDGASYAMLVLPQNNPLVPNENSMLVEVAEKLLALIKSGATVLVGSKPEQSISLNNAAENDKRVRHIVAAIWDGDFAEEGDEMTGKIMVKSLGQGRVVRLPYQAYSLDLLGLERDVIVSEGNRYAEQMAWTHRRADSTDIYLISNQKNEMRNLTLSLRTSGKAPEIWNVVTGEIIKNTEWTQENGRTILPIQLPENGSLFIVLRTSTKATKNDGKNWANPKPMMVLDGAWQVSFSDIESYSQTFTWIAPSEAPQRTWLELGRVVNLAEVTLNGQPCGAVWTAPYRVEISHALKEGINELVIDVTNTWADAMNGNYALKSKFRLWTPASEYSLRNKPLQEMVLPSEVKILGE